MEKPDERQDIVLELFALSSGGKGKKVLARGTASVPAGQLYLEEGCATPEDRFQPVKVNRKYGYQDPEGNMVIAPVYDKAYHYSEGVATVRKGKKYGIIDLQG